MVGASIQRKRWIVAAFMAFLCHESSSAPIYGYTDEDGGIHLSTVPYDTRYVLLSSGDQLGEALRSRVKTVPAHPFVTIVKNIAARERIDEALLHAVMKTESGFDPNVVSKKGAIGLMQLMPATAQRYGISNPKDPAENIAGGALYLKDLLKMFNNNLQLVLAAYNAGESAVVRYGNAIPPFRETEDYVNKALAHYRSFSGCEVYGC